MPELVDIVDSPDGVRPGESVVSVGVAAVVARSAPSATALSASIPEVPDANEAPAAR